jgi:hypothetical protein
MPRALEPGLIFPIVLESDKGRDPQPTFLAKSLSIRGLRMLSECVQKIQDAPGSVDTLEAAVNAAAYGLVGWRNMVDPQTQQEIKYSPAALADVMALDELMELVGKIASAGRLAEDDRKKSESQP